MSTKFKRKIRKFNAERLVSIPREIEDFEVGDHVFLIFDGTSILIEKRGTR